MLLNAIRRPVTWLLGVRMSKCHCSIGIELAMRMRSAISRLLSTLWDRWRRMRAGSLIMNLRASVGRLMLR